MQNRRNIFMNFIGLLLTGILLALFQSEALLTWAYDLPSNDGSEFLIFYLEKFNAFSQNLGFPGITKNFRGWFLEMTNAF